MRQETNNEMDLLLRRLGRRQETPASSDHLDADELNSYAENVLPPAARARYTEHLAECAPCRDLVVQLSSSAGVVVAPETPKVSEPSALRKFLASLFSPMVLRYAVPAMGLVVVAAIGFIVSRNEGVNSPVAEVRDNQAAQTSAPASQPQPSSSPGVGINFALSDSTKSENKPAVKSDTDAQTGAAAPPPPNAPPTVGSINAEVQQPVKTAERQQEEPKEAAPPPKATPAISEMKKADPEVQKQAPADTRTVVANEPAAEKAKTQDRTEADAAAPASSAARNRAQRRDVTSLGGSLKREDDAEKDKNDADTRTVAGRRFRRQGSVWIDTAYSSARSTADLSRGSEAYRALVADEPAIKQIADTLDGEIIVVWKNRAYRIR